MVHVLKGVLVECNPQMKQFLLHLDVTEALNTKFILQDLDATHLFVSAECVNLLKAKIDDLMEQVNFVENN